MWRGILAFVAGLVLSLVFAAAAVASVAGTFAILKDGITSKGVPGQFEAHMRHYTDRLETAPDGTLRLIRAEHPTLQVIGSTVVAWLVVVASGVALRRVVRMDRTDTAPKA